jgi:hypothetical protein
MGRFLIAAAVAPLGAGLVYGVLVALHPLGEGRDTFSFLVTICLVSFVAELVSAFLAFLAGRAGREEAGPWTWPIGFSVATGVVVTQVFGIPAMSYGGLSTAQPRLSEVVTAAIVFAFVGVMRALVLLPTPAGMPNGPSRRQLAGALVAGLLLVGVSSVLWPELTVFWRSPDRVEAYLLTKTPLGTPEAGVTAWLRTRGREEVPRKVSIRPNSDYPVTRTGGAAFIHTVVAEYRLIFWTSVEAFYTFDASGRLVDLRVRATVDGL